MSRRKSILMTCAILSLPLLSVLIAFVAGEIGFRLYQRQATGIPFRSTGGQEEWNPAWALVLDDTLGWRARAGYQDLHVVTETTSKGVKYPIKRSQKEYGFRMFGDLHSTRPKVFVIGDSFTQANFRLIRQEMLRIACGAAKNMRLELNWVIGICIDAPKFHRDVAEDFLLMKCDSWTNEQRQEIEEQNVELRFFKTPQLMEYKKRSVEFPSTG